MTPFCRVEIGGNMAVILGNKYQSKNRDNFRKITGLSEANEKIKPENMPRIYGGIGEVYFNGQSAAGSSTGNGGGSTGTTDPNGGSGSGGGSSGSGGGSECQCETLPDALIVNGVPCCVAGVDCEDGKPIQVQLDPNGDGEPILPCETPPPPPYGGDDTIVINWHNLHCGKYFSNEYFLADMGSGAGVAEEALQQSLDTYLCITSCGGMSAGDKRDLSTATKNGKTFQYYSKQVAQSEQCGTWTAYCNVITSPSKTQYDAALKNWGKNAAIQYFVKDGKFYDVCDPYGKPPIECVEMCDEDGNKYQVCGDGKITEL